jgi:hypothetical protein
MGGAFNGFISRWSASAASERANKDSFLNDLCDVLDVPRPMPATGDPEKDSYVFERDATLVHEGSPVSVGHIDLYKEGCFILEAKQGSEKGSKKLGTAKRGTPGWNIAMKDAFGQALGYARSFDRPPPFIVACDIGHCFDLYSSFERTIDYTPFPNALSSRIYLPEIEKHADVLRGVFLEPLALDPARKSTKVTREVAVHLADLAKALEADGHGGEAIATFLMRCIFTMFAEDVGLLPERTFTESVERFWLPSPASFPAGVSALWHAMNEGGPILTGAKLLKFNGGLFAQPDALPLNKGQLRLLLDAAKCNWSDVEPAIFGTLLERALDPDERHALGAHFTPKAYVERLVRPTIEEPLRADWTLVQAEVRHLVEADDITKARKVVREFHRKLCSIKVLDPACGSGNFLYVTLDLFKRLEAEVLALLGNLGEAQTILEMQTVSVNPSQFLGIEVKRWAKEIAELVLWIGYLQWHFRSYRRGDKAAQVPEPVLQDFKNIECRDAVLAWDGEPELVRDEHGKPVSRWDGKSTKKHPVTGEDVPDDTKTIPVYRYVNPRKADWPKATFVVGNPPFLGNKLMRTALGDEYAAALRDVYPDVPSSADLVFYWWDKAARLVSAGAVRRFGLITTNSINQSFNRRILDEHLRDGRSVHLVFAIADHPWVDRSDDAAVRVAMTVGEAGAGEGERWAVVSELPCEDGTASIAFDVTRGRINSDLSVGADAGATRDLQANSGLAFTGMYPLGQGFVLDHQDLAAATGDDPAERRFLRPFVTARDLTQVTRGTVVIDLFPLADEAARHAAPHLFQWLLNRVKPQRDEDKRENYRIRWWLFAEARPGLRQAVSKIPRFVVVPRTAKHFSFQFVPPYTVPDSTVVALATPSALALGVLSSRIHLAWALATGGRLEDRPRYQHASTFNRFPFPVCTDAQDQRIRDLGEALDAHRKLRQAEHSDLTMTGMYNVLEKLRSGEVLTAKEKNIHEKGLVSVLKKLHDDLDDAVFDAYGWPHDLTDEQILERLVALNAERAEEEKRGIVRWLRPEYQTKVVKTGLPVAAEEEGEAQEELAVEPTTPTAPAKKRKRGRAGEEPVADDSRSGAARKAWATRRAAAGRTSKPPAAQPEGAKRRWPDSLPDQIAAVRDLILGTTTAWTSETVARSFKFARATSVEPVLESLAALGLLVRYKVGGERAYRAAGRG